MRSSRRSCTDPLIDRGDQLDACAACRLPRPRLGDPAHHGLGDFELLLARVGVDDVFAEPAAESIGGPAVEGAELRRRQPPRPDPALRRPPLVRGGSSRLRGAPRVRSISLAHIGKVPVHDADGGREPQQEHQAQRYAKPAVDEDQRAFIAPVDPNSVLCFATHGGVCAAVSDSRHSVREVTSMPHARSFSHRRIRVRRCSAQPGGRFSPAASPSSTGHHRRRHSRRRR